LSRAPLTFASTVISPDASMLRESFLGEQLSRILVQRSARFDRVVLTLPFYLLFLVQLVHHEVWRDEINAWAISYVSHSIPELLYRVHYEAHPALWYIILFAASRFTHALWMLKLVEAVIGTGIYCLLAFASPFGWRELLLILLSYYLVFEYTVMCRMYSLELLAALAYGYFRTRRPDWVFRNTLWLALMANVDSTGAILGGALLLESFLDRFKTERGLSASQKTREVLGAVAIFLVACGISLETLWPAKDIAWTTTGKIFSNFWDAGHLVQSALNWIAVPWIPRSINMVGLWEFTDWPYFFFAPFVLFVLYIIFRNHWRVGAMMAAVIAGGTLFSQITNVAAIRHTGVVFIAFLFALWMFRFRGEPVSIFAYGLLALTAITGIIAIIAIIAIIDQWSLPYADSGYAAAWIQQNHLEDLTLFGGVTDTSLIGVPERLDRPIYQISCGCFDRVLTFSDRRDHFIAEDEAKRESDMPLLLIRGFHDVHVQTGLFLNTHKLTLTQRKRLAEGGLEAQLIGQFDHGFLDDENIYIYRVSVVPHS
jgi:hypothetical protein